MAAGGQNGQAEGHGAADVKQREAIDGGIELIQPVDLRKAPGRMDLVSMRQADEFWPSGGPAGVEQRADGVAILRWLEVWAVVHGRDRLIEAHRAAGQAAVRTDHEDRLERWDAARDIDRLGPDRAIGGLGSDHQDSCVLRFE